VVLVDDLSLESPKTQVFYQILEALDVNEGSALVVVSEPNEFVRLAARNIPLVEVTTNENLNTYQLLRYDKLLFTRTAFERLEERAAQ
jgi:large subunit ribosomal protein L4